MASTQLGTIKTLIPGAQVTVSRTGVTYTLPKSMSSVDALDPTQHPPIGTVLQILGHYTTLDSYSIVKEEGDVATVNYNYVGSNADAGEGSNNGDTPPPLPGYSFSGTPPSRYDLDATTEAVSILRLYRFASIPAADRNILAMMIQNGPLDADGNDISSGLTNDAKTQEAATLIKAGTVSKECPALIWRKTAYNTSWANALLPGFIISPPGPVPTIDGNWILSGFSGTGYDDFAESLTATYKSSIIGDVWNETLYRR
jgi:hypothetical protein